MKIGVIVVATKEILPYTVISIPSIVDYCLLHGYDFHLEQNIERNRDATWNKIPAMSKHIYNYDWVWCLDADCKIVNKDIRLEDIIEEYAEEKDNILIGDDTSNGGNINCGSMLIRCGEEMHGFLDDWWFEGSYLKLERKPFHEQETLDKMRPSFMKIIPLDVINSHWKEKNPRFVFHAMGRSIEEKVIALGSS